ncbi:MAG: ATP-grasp domain-containing protein [Candidatus Helarchaeota archaeon]
MVRLFEYQAKRFLKQAGISIPKSELIRDLPENPPPIKFPAMLKAQVLTGGRKKAGGVVEVEDFSDLRQQYLTLKDKKIRGFSIDSFLLEEKIPFDVEFYFSILIDRDEKRPLLLFSQEGGIDIEETAPELIYKKPLPPVRKPLAELLTDLELKISLEHEIISKLREFINQCWNLAWELDAELLEINPLVIGPDKNLLALDVHVKLDENALFRHGEFEENLRREFTADEWSAREKGMALVELEQKEGVGIICNGAGLVMATMDAVKKQGGTPINFLDIGGGADRTRILHALNLISKNKNAKIILVNIFGGITRCDEIAHGIIEFKTKSSRELLIRMIGTNFEKGKEMLAEKNIPSFRTMPEVLEALKTKIREINL